MDQHCKTLDGGTIQIPAATLEALRARLRGALISPGDAGYDQGRELWNGMFDRRPALIIKCAGVADVIDAVRFVAEHGLLVSVKAGGHNAAGLAVCDHGVVIDVSGMKGIWVDPRRRRARVQAGALWRDVDRETQAFGLVTPGGVVSDTGVAGLTLGGGYGWTRRKLGMTIDCLRAVELVTAEGELITASADEHQELFWGLRGGGGNFGVVTSLEYELYPLGPEVMFAAAIYPMAEAKKVLHAWRQFLATAPDEVSTDAALWSAQPGLPAELVGKDVIILVGMYAGDPRAGEKAMQPIREVMPPLLDLSAVMPYTAAQTAFDPFFPKGKQRYWKSIYTNALDDDLIDTLVNAVNSRPSKDTLVSIRHLGGAMSRVGADATAFGARDAQFLVSLDATWNEPSASATNIDWTRALWREFHRFSSGAMSLNFPGMLEEGQELMKATFGDNYERLVALKTKYDHRNLFRFTQNITPQAK